MCKNASVMIIPIPCLRDNYAYLVHRPGSRDAFVVDPSEAAPVEREVATRGLRLKAIACTHHHWDHVGGIPDLRRPGLPVYGHEMDSRRIGGLTHPLRHGDVVALAGVPLRVLHVPGHTIGAITYVGEGFAFTGDTLFCGGCGRLFEGSAEEMYRSLNVVLGELPGDTVVYTGHEYTEQNLAFAVSMEPDNLALRERWADVRRRRKTGDYCAAASLELERETNPFLRCHLPSLKNAVPSDDEDAGSVFAALRLKKDAA